MGPIGIYYLVSFNGRDFAGAFNKPSDMPGPPGWLGYVRVKNVENTVKAAKKAGGTLINGPMEVPGGDWVAQLLDPQGGMFAVHMLAADVQAADSTSQRAPAESPATIEVTGAARSEEPAAKPAAAKRAAKKKPRKTESTAKAKSKSAPRPATRSKTATRTKKKSAKSLKRSARKAVKVRSQTSKLKAKAAPGRKKTASKPKKRAAAKAKKGK